MVCGLAAALLAAGCGAARVEQSAPEDTRPRREKVAAAWEGSAAVRQWREGFHPLDAEDWQPPGGFRSGEDKVAYLARNFLLRAELPAGPAPVTPIRWADGSTLTLPLQDAAEAYEEVDQEPDRDHALTVTAVRFGETSAPTSRGPAVVPAWLFTVEGYDTPLARIAVRPQELPEPPVLPEDRTDPAVAPLTGHSAPLPDATAFTVTAGHGSCDAGAAVDVLEGADTVVLAGRILVRTDLDPGAACDAMLRAQHVQVTLARPLGDRLVVDAATGAPLPYRPDR
ncbi:hypothetical protein AB0D54_14095 [Streptomyces xanthophaeus]|uniref:hypothetical protein n=1 Tax=Streptomyces xanthophaeus TaxID=67385 RepID=UPI0034179B8F